jgi:hypothetical protein
MREPRIVGSPNSSGLISPMQTRYFAFASISFASTSPPSQHLLARSTITPLVKGTRTDGTNMYGVQHFFFATLCHTLFIFRYCLCINRVEAADALNQSSPEESVDKFSRQAIFACFEEMKSLEEFVDAVKRLGVSASQLLNYIDSLPLAPKRDKGSLGGKG